MKDNFKQALKYVLKDEGGNSDDPRDHGGRTSRGITQREYDAWLKLSGEKSKDVWKASNKEIELIYNSQYWQPYCDDLPDGLDYLYFDISVNCGRTQATRQFQKALGVKVDGMMGQVTESAIQEADPVELIKKVCEARRAFYRSLKQFPIYGKGWLSRVDHSGVAAFAMAKNKKFDKPAVKDAPKTDGTPATPVVPPEASGGVAVGTGGLISILDSFKDSLTPYADTVKYVNYVLIAVAVVGLAYSVYGFIKRNKIQQAQ